jgi:DNA-binding NtrC family response regulator
MLLRRKPDEVMERIAPDLIVPMLSVKRRAIESALILCRGNHLEAARRLEISYTSLRKLAAQYRKADA